MHWYHWLWTCPLVVLVGCSAGSFDFVPVKGRVTLDGAPLADAEVRFQPTAASDDANVGSGSVARTDAEGRFELHAMLQPDRIGAVAGEHRVWITTARENTHSETGLASAEKVPPQYRNGLSFTVPTAGSTSADFSLSSTSN
jgi:hypothetical protein